MSLTLFFIFCISAFLICVENYFVRIPSSSKIFPSAMPYLFFFISKLSTWPFFMGPYSLLMFSNIFYFSIRVVSYFPIAVSENFVGVSILFLQALLDPLFPCCVLCFLTVSYCFPWNFIWGKSLRTESQLD